MTSKLIVFIIFMVLFGLGKNEVVSQEGIDEFYTGFSENQTVFLPLVINQWFSGWLSTMDTDDDLSITLYVKDEVIRESPGDWCHLLVVVRSDDVPLSYGDTIDVFVFEDDVVEDEIIFSTEYFVTNDEVDSGEVYAWFDCSEPVPLEGDDVIEVYADVTTNKDACGTFCFQDNATTDLLYITIQ